MERGVIRNRDWGKQLRDFSSLIFERGITPTDIDAFIEFDNEIFIFIEAKHGGSSMQRGQQLALERLTDAIELNDDKHSILIIATHDIPHDKDIELGNCLVSRYRQEGKWNTIGHLGFDVRTVINMFRNRFSDNEGN